MVCSICTTMRRSVYMCRVFFCSFFSQRPTTQNNLARFGFAGRSIDWWAPRDQKYQSNFVDVRVLHPRGYLERTLGVCTPVPELQNRLNEETLLVHHSDQSKLAPSRIVFSSLSTTVKKISFAWSDAVGALSAFYVAAVSG